MNKLLYALFIATTILVLSSGARKSAGPPGCHAGEPPLNKTCVSCHDDNPLNSGSAAVTFDIGGAETGYVPGQTYTVTVTINKPGMKAAGFQTIALQDNNTSRSPGLVILTEPGRTQTVDASNPHAHGCSISNKVWVEHKYQGIFSDTTGESKWTYQWKAPDSLVGDVTFYLAALEADLSLDSDGDFTYTRSITSPALLTNVLPNSRNHSALVDVFPNPATEILSVRVNDAHAISNVFITDLTGVVLKQHRVIKQDLNAVSIEVNDLPNGIYLVVVNGADVNAVKKVVVSR